MERFEVHPLAIVGGILCFVVGSHLAIFWSHEAWSLFGESDPPREREENSAEKVPDQSSEQPTRESFERSGPAVPFEESVREPEEADDESLAPVYRELPERCGSIRTEQDGEERAFPPKETDYRVGIRGDLAAVTVEQTFVNSTDSTIDAVYQFPLNRRAAVYAMTMHVGERVVRATIEKEQEAREAYERANRRDKKAALLSQERPNWFTQRVANLEAGQQVRVTLRYVHPLPREEGAYQFVAPTRLGKRYGDGASARNDLVFGDGESEAVSAPSERGSKVSVEVRIEAPMPVRRIRSASHMLRLRKYDADDWRVDLARDGEMPDEHFRMSFETSGAEPEVGLNTYWDEEAEKGYFSLLMEPPRRPDPREISNREIVFVMDTSGSMQGEPIAKSKRFVKAALRELRRVRDSFRIVEFNNAASEFSSEPIEANDETVGEALEYVDELAAGGGTEYEPGLERALGPATPIGAVRLVVFLTDGKIGYEFEALRALRERVGEARLFGIGIGPSVNRYLLEEMGRMGRGFARFLGKDHPRRPEMKVGEEIEWIVDRIEAPILTDLRVDWGSLEVTGVSPKPVPDLFAGESVRVHGTYANPGEHTVKVHGTMGADRVMLPVTRKFPGSEGDGEAVELTWARQKIRETMHDLMGARLRDGGGTSPEVYRERIVDLGLEHSLVTQWTSFVAVAESGEMEDGTVEEPGVNKMLSSESLGEAALENVFGSGKGGKGFSNKMQVAQRGTSRSRIGRGSGGMGLRGSGGGGGGEGFGRVHGLGKVASGEDRKNADSTAGTTSGNLAAKQVRSEESIEKELAGHEGEIRSCYEQRRKSAPDLEGKIVVRITVQPSGTVSSVNIEKSTVDDTKLEECVRTEIRDIEFSERANVEETELSHPYLFGEP